MVTSDSLCNKYYAKDNLKYVHTVLKWGHNDNVPWWVWEIDDQWMGGWSNVKLCLKTQFKNE